MDDSFKFKESPSNSPLFQEKLQIPETFPPAEMVPSKTRLIREGANPKRVGLLVSGIVKRSRTSGDNSDEGVGLHSEGYWVGALPAALRMPSLHNVDTLTSCSIIFFDLEEFRKLAETDSWVIRSLFRGHSEQLAIYQFREISHGGEGRLET